MHSAICQICGNKFTARAKTTKYCSACVSKAKADAALHRKEQLNRPPTTDTEFLNRGDSISRIATDLNRSEEDVQSILNEAKASGRYNMHIQKHLNSVNYKSTLSDDYVDSVWDSEKAGLTTNTWQSGIDVYHWWMEDNVLPGQLTIDGENDW